MPMSSLGSTVSIDGPDGAFDAAVSQPESPNGNAVVVVQEIFGVNKKIRAYCDLFAKAGYLAIAPDLFWRHERNLQLTYSEEDMKRALSLAASFDEAKGCADIKAAIGRLRSEGARKVAVVGFCLGGKLAALAAANGDANAGVGFYGIGLDKAEREMSTAQSPIQLHFGEKDNYIPATAVAQIKTLLGPRPDAEVHSYAEASHGFFRPDFKDTASPVAWDRTVGFLKRHLG